MPKPLAPSDSQSPEQIAAAIEAYLQAHDQATVLEDGKAVFDMREAKYALSTEHGRCSLHLWSEQRNVVRRVVEAKEKNGNLRLATLRMGQSQTKLLELVADRSVRTPTTRDAARARYLRTLERVLARECPDWHPDGFRTAMDLERSFGPAYARGSLIRGASSNRSAQNNKDAWAVIGVSRHESQAIIDGILTLGILWLHTCREQAAGKRLYRGLRVIAPRGSADLTLSRMAWLNVDAAQWELWELDDRSEELHQRDLDDRGNLRTRLVHHLDESAAAERFAEATAQVLSLIPAGNHARVDQRLRSASEMVFSLHGLAFARARIGLAPNSFARTLEITVGAGAEETELHNGNREDLAALVEELFDRRQAKRATSSYARRASLGLTRRIGPPKNIAAHSRVHARATLRSDDRLNSAQDPLFRASPERWLESMLRADLAPLTRGLAPTPGRAQASANRVAGYADDPDPDTIGNRADPLPAPEDQTPSRVIPRLDPRHIYTQVPAIAGAGDRGMLDLLGVTTDGRLAVIELKADDDLHLALQGLDYWIRVRHHHLQNADAVTGLGEFQRHGYFKDVQLSPLAPRLYLVAPALHIHPATETVLRYVSPRVEWTLLALDERWREAIRVVWRKSGGKPAG